MNFHNFNFGQTFNPGNTEPVNNTKLYETLELKQTATLQEIKAAYKKLARKYHPDKNPGDASAAEKFKEIGHAYEILSKPEKKEIYDQYGEEGLDGSGGQSFNPFDLLQRSHHKQAAPMNHQITLAEYFAQKPISMTIPRRINCETCNTTGFSDKQTHVCKKCNGTGYVIRQFHRGNIHQQVRQGCDLCRGQRIDTQANHLKCTVCSGMGTITENSVIDVDVPINIMIKPITIVAGQGPWHNGAYMDLAVVFKLELPENYMLASDKKLMYQMHINFTETICGFRRIIDHPAGRKILIVSEAGDVVNPNNWYKLDGQGFLTNYSADLMYLSFNVHYPESLTMPKTKKALTYNTLERALGNRFAPNDNDSEVEVNNIFNLKCIPNFDPQSAHGHPSMDSDEEGQEQTACVQQ